MASRTPFGKESRIRILRQHLGDAGTITAATAWQFIYRELLWIDGSTGLAHLYESDKAQPGRPWYDRSVVFTNMLCERFGNISRENLRQQIDKLFRACLGKLVERRGIVVEEGALIEALTTLHPPSTLTDEIVLAATNGGHDNEIEPQDSTSEQYIPDADLVAEFSALLVLHARMAQAEAELFAHDLVAKARFYFTVERKRQNVLGEGFEDLLQLLMLRVSHVPEHEIKIRQRANKLPGFQSKTSTRERIESPDIAIVRNNRTELLASVKWSLRHDRQKQLSDELDCYVDLLSQDGFPQYVLITNEYDPGRLVNTDGLNRRGHKINHIYHINLELLLGALDSHERLGDLRPLIDSRRLRSVEDFLNDLAQQ